MVAQQLLDFLPLVLIGGFLLGAGGIFAYAQTTRMKIKNGYPLENMWGMPIHPKQSTEETERVRMLTQENAQLRAEIGSLKDRMVSVERIVTDSGYRLTHEIESLRDANDAN